MTELELTILNAFVSGDNEELRILQEQSRRIRVRDREYTGVGFFTRFAVAADAPKLSSRNRLIISDVGADIDQLERGSGFILFVENGVIDCLEGFAYAEAWPLEARLRRWYYLRHPNSSSAALIETTERDLNYAFSKQVD